GVGSGDRLAAARGALEGGGDVLHPLLVGARRPVAHAGPHQRHDHEGGDDEPAPAAGLGGDPAHPSFVPDSWAISSSSSSSVTPPTIRRTTVPSGATRNDSGTRATP